MYKAKNEGYKQWFSFLSNREFSSFKISKNWGKHIIYFSFALNMKKKGQAKVGIIIPKSSNILIQSLSIQRKIDDNF